MDTDPQHLGLDTCEQGVASLGHALHFPRPFPLSWLRGCAELEELELNSAHVKEVCPFQATPSTFRALLSCHGNVDAQQLETNSNHRLREKLLCCGRLGSCGDLHSNCLRENSLQNGRLAASATQEAEYSILRAAQGSPVQLACHRGC